MGWVCQPDTYWALKSFDRNRTWTDLVFDFAVCYTGLLRSSGSQEPHDTEVYTFPAGDDVCTTYGTFINHLMQTKVVMT